MRGKEGNPAAHSELEVLIPSLHHYWVFLGIQVIYKFLQSGSLLPDYTMPWSAQLCASQSLQLFWALSGTFLLVLVSHVSGYTTLQV